MNIYRRTVQSIRDRRRAEVDAAHIAWQELLRSDDGLYAAFVAYQEELIKRAKGEKHDAEAAQKKLAAQKKRLGISDDFFDPPPHCPLCKDTGYVGDDYCSCVIRAAINADRQNLTLPAVDFDEAESTAPAAIKKAYAAAREYISSTGGKPFFTLIGEPGTGKTVLAAAIATSLIKKGASAVTVTAFDFVRRALDYHTQFKIDDYVDRFTPMLDCDLLVIDDLGKETTLKNVSQEYLFSVIYERSLHKKRTVITSNLDPSAILHRYGEALTSRMLDKSISENFAVYGKNSRISD